MARRTAALPQHSAPVQHRCWPHRGPRSGAPASHAIPLLTASNPTFFAVADIESRIYNWLLLRLGASHFFLINAMLLSLPLSLAANAAGIADLLNVSALLVDKVLVRRWHFLQQHALSRVQQRCSKPPQTLSTPSPSILHTCPSFHTRHFHYRHPYTRLQYRLGHRSRTNLTHHMT